jgi:hypothetical protein
LTGETNQQQDSNSTNIDTMTKTMKLLLGVSLFAVTSAFTTQPLTFRFAPVVRDESAELFGDQEKAHHERRSTILMDGKANGECQLAVLSKFSLFVEQFIALCRIH